METQRTACCVASAVAGPAGLTPLQKILIEALIPAMTGHPVDVDACPALSAREVALALVRRDLQFRTRVVQIMLLCALVLRPLPEEVTDQVAGSARELGVDEGMVEVARRFAGGSLGLAAIDFERNGYSAA